MEISSLFRHNLKQHNIHADNDYESLKFNENRSLCVHTARSQKGSDKSKGWKLHNNSQPGALEALVDARRNPGFKVEIDITIHSRTCGVLTGHVVDISESGIGAILRIEVPMGANSLSWGSFFLSGQ